MFYSGRRHYRASLGILSKIQLDYTAERFKARLGVRGNTQQKMLISMRYFRRWRDMNHYNFIGDSYYKDLHIHQVNVSTAFLNGSVFEDIYMQQPLGFRHGDASSVCKLKKSQTGSAYMEYCLYRQKLEINGVNHIVLLYVYVYDITIIRSSMILMQKLKVQMASSLSMNDSVESHYLLKMEIERDRANKVLSMFQHKYILDLLQKFEMTECSSELTPQAKGVTYGLIFDGKSKEVIYELYTDASFVNANENTSHCAAQRGYSNCPRTRTRTRRNHSLMSKNGSHLVVIQELMTMNKVLAARPTIVEAVLLNPKAKQVNAETKQSKESE
ncbi:Gag-pol Polyprotein [Phytophthora palmivora]|uniref:Gag-pol Polyprotein n=1 Tax=Phytophthora palmivora TaxID=4796 RepID=A0A2P4XBQ9_9STRA|nr:Gag-pol Polyprotein [Phytophthora palmivora]